MIYDETDIFKVDADTRIITYTAPEHVNMDAANNYVEEINKIFSVLDGPLDFITDLTNVTNLPTLDVVKAFGKQMKANRPRINRSAVVTGDETTRVVGIRSMLVLTGRSDIKVFRTYKEALEFITS